ncbi:MAG: TonB-dependent receptor plug domain-containing protein [Bacteroidota bacterium]|nr:TonB-dependent receptor plug domain-containing protein [Bacteroidota bacterium]
MFFPLTYKHFIVIILLLPHLIIYGQTTPTDTLKEIQLSEVTVKAFEQNRRLKDIAGAIALTRRQTLERFSSASIVSAINITPGVRMEERSPGSYRFNIRGSSLRSPFGVRNVKVYYNDVPLTDPGGTTYLNQLGYYNFNSVEIIKGPGSSLYGAGTGGVLLIESMDGNEQPGIFAEYTTGSYNLQNAYASFTTRSENLVSRTSYQHQESDGYRNHSELKRSVISWSGNFKLNENRQLKTSFIYGDLFYETPGALTLTEFNSNSRMARPGTAFFPGAEAARAAIYQKTFVAGASYTQQLTPTLESKSSLYGAYTQLKNPAIRNYGHNSEPHAGGRTVLKWAKKIQELVLGFTGGAEWQQGFSSFSTHTNKNGNADSVQILDEVRNRQSFLFGQTSLENKNWIITGGASFNAMKINIERFIPTPIPEQKRKISNELAPRLALLYKLNSISIYSSISKGFSPPTTAELLPTGSAINLDLNAEEGVNYDAGLRGTIFKNLYVDINAFVFSLKNTIVQRRDAGGGELFINAGKTKQRGIETYIGYPLFTSAPIISRSNFWLSHTYHHFKYRDFKQLSLDFSGNKLPGVAPHSISSGIDILFNNGFLGTLSYYYSDKLPLSDANDLYADDYHLVGAKIGYQKLFNNKWRIKIVAGSENLLDEKYSLGNDINGFGGRYYNAAPGRNYYASLLLQYITKR